MLSSQVHRTMSCRGRGSGSIRHNQNTSRSLVRHAENRGQSHNHRRTVLPPIVTDGRNLVILKVSQALHANSPNPIVGVQPRPAHGRMLNRAQNVPLRRRKRPQAADANCGRTLQARLHLLTRKSLKILRIRMHHTNDAMVAFRTDILPLSRGKSCCASGLGLCLWRSAGAIFWACDRSVTGNRRKWHIKRVIQSNSLFIRTASDAFRSN